MKAVQPTCWGFAHQNPNFSYFLDCLQGLVLSGREKNNASLWNVLEEFNAHIFSISVFAYESASHKAPVFFDVELLPICFLVFHFQTTLFYFYQNSFEENSFHALSHSTKTFFPILAKLHDNGNFSNNTTISLYDKFVTSNFILLSPVKFQALNEYLNVETPHFQRFQRRSSIRQLQIKIKN